MPPTAFHPTHSTPFKSSISSSQQARRRQTEQAEGAAPSSLQWPESIAVQTLDSRHWTYLAEGGKNLVLRYEGPDEYPFFKQGRRIALRLSKVPRTAPSDGQARAEGEEIEAVEWRDSVLLPDLSSVGSLPPLLRLQDQSAHSSDTKRFLREMASKVEVMRPMERRRVSGLDETAREGVFVTEDLSASIAGRQTISFEVKPKCGFLPKASHLSRETAGIKGRYCRYRMHRVLKSHTPPSLEEFERFYDPLDLYSGQQDRVDKASRALYDDWVMGEGNLRIFANGERVEAATVGLRLDEMAREHFDSPSLQAMFSSLLVGSGVQNVLQQLKHLQSKYDDLDVEGVAALYRSETGVSLTEAREAPVNLGEYQDAVLSRPGQGGRARSAVVKLLLSAMYKDCSLFIRAISGEPSASLYLVDLDPKPVTKLGYFEQLDKDVTHNFQGWARRAGAAV